MSQITNISTSVLRVHPRNQEFFDDIEGDNYTQFKNSIKEDGIITPLIVASDMTIISGHQRYQAAKDLGITQVPVIIREDLEDEDEQLKKLLATNFGRMKNDPTKQRKVAVQYVELCGLKHGQRQDYQSSDNRNSVLTQEEIAKQLGISVTTLNEILTIERKLTPEIKELLDTGIISKTSASKIWTKLSEGEQEELLQELGKDKIKAMTIKETKELMQKHSLLKQENEELRNRKPVEVVPDDYNQLKYVRDRLVREIEELQEKVEKQDNNKKDNAKLRNELTSKSEEVFDLKKQIEQIVKTDSKTKHKEKLKDNALIFCTRIHTFINDVGGLAWMTDYIDELDDYDRDSYIKALELLEGWVLTVKSNITKED